MSGWNSRSSRRPRQWSRSPLLRRIPRIGEWRGPRGWSRGKLSIWRWMSGEALSRNQSPPSALIATDSWVRGTAEIVPSRNPRQFGHPQFHWGNPPPAAEPRTRISTVNPPPRQGGPSGRPGGRGHFISVWERASWLEAVVRILLVRIDLGVHLHFDECRSLPGHLDHPQFDVTAWVQGLVPSQVGVY